MYKCYNEKKLLLKKKKKKKGGKKKVEKNKTSTTKSFSKSRDQFLLCGDDRLNAEFFLPLPATAIPDRQKFRNKRSVRAAPFGQKINLVCHNVGGLVQSAANEKKADPRPSYLSMGSSCP